MLWELYGVYRPVVGSGTRGTIPGDRGRIASGACLQDSGLSLRGLAAHLGIPMLDAETGKERKRLRALLPVAKHC